MTVFCEQEAYDSMSETANSPSPSSLKQPLSSDSMDPVAERMDNTAETTRGLIIEGEGGETDLSICSNRTEQRKSKVADSLPGVSSRAAHMLLKDFWLATASASMSQSLSGFLVVRQANADVLSVSPEWYLFFLN